ncbi:MAG: hypothetical protein RM049_25875 [Nostoc sp. DedQUE04]|uniref:hypothetical protein n=1 Tax=Nostoc sp. DedQUE04 TaxID=3075390 RepID=UPI002AD4B88A|nr:hypothetical protein [Nostoc sp. DedQUE04]MDZ8138692.1 hypothetical protein [Nostoc sp. DedQUE04]
MTKAKTKDSPSSPTEPDTNSLDPRLAQIIQLYTLGQQEYDGIRDYPLHDSLAFENEIQFLIYKQGFEDAIYDQSFKSELDDPEFMEWQPGSVYRGWTHKGKEYDQAGYWIIRWTNSLGQTGRTKVNA